MPIRACGPSASFMCDSGYHRIGDAQPDRASHGGIEAFSAPLGGVATGPQGP
jgi:hypothetical protein